MGGGGEESRLMQEKETCVSFFLTWQPEIPDVTSNKTGYTAKSGRAHVDVGRPSGKKVDVVYFTQWIRTVWAKRGGGGKNEVDSKI